VIVVSILWYEEEVCRVSQKKLRNGMKLIIIIIIIILGISFMQGIYAYIPETNHVPREHCVATILM
jgi:phosphoribosyl 1,2-cyclic phosphodiesterase